MALTAPTNVQVTALSSTSLRVTWTPAVNTDGTVTVAQLIAWRVSPDGTFSFTFPRLGASDTSYDITGLSPSTVYDVYVGNSNSANGGLTVYSAEVRGTTQGDTAVQAPGSPRNVSASATHNSITMSWDAPNTGGAPTLYRIAYQVHPGGVWHFRTTSSTSYTITNLAASTTYNVQVRAENSGGNSSYAGSAAHPSGITTSAQVTPPGVPRNVSASATSSTAVRLEWDAPNTGGAPTSYQVQYKLSTANAWTDAADVIEPSDITGLTPETLYNLHVRARNSGGDSAWVTASATTQPDNTLTLAATAGQEQVTLQWNLIRVSGSLATHHSLERRVGTAAWAEIVEVPNPPTASFGDPISYADTGLTAGTAYQYRVRSRRVTTYSSYSSTRTATPTAPAAANAPTAVTATASDHESISVSWTAPATGTVDSYSVRYRAGTTGDFTTLTGITGTSREITGLDPETTYQVQVQAVNSGGSSAWTPGTLASATTPAAPDITDVPLAPTRVIADWQAAARTVITWTAPVSAGSGGAVTGYEIQRWDAGSGWMQLVDNTGNTSTSYTDTATLTVGVQYNYAIRAINSAGRGEWGQSQLLTAGDLYPSAPRRFVADAQSSGVVMSWLVPADSGHGQTITGYQVYRTADGGANWSQIATLGAVTVYTDTTSLIEGASYFYAIRAVNANGTGEWAGSSAVVINPSLPAAPRRLRGDAQSSGVVLDWLAPVDAGTGGAVSGYRVYRYDGAQYTQIATVTDSDYTDTATLAVGSQQFYAVRAVNAAGVGEWSEAITVVINPSLPSAPLRLLVTEGTSEITLTWLPPEDSGLGGAITGYSIWRHQNGMWAEYVVDTGTTMTRYVDALPVADGGWHYYVVRARNASGAGEWSAVAGVTTSTNVPGPPQSLYAVEVATGVQLAWTAPASDGGSPITGYSIWRIASGEWTQLVVNTASTDTTYIDTMVVTQGHGGYIYRVQAITANGAGDFSAAATVQYGPQTDGTAEAPTGLTAVHGANGAIELSWAAPFDSGTHDIDGYSIECWTPDRGWYVCLDDTESTDTEHTLAAATATGVHLFRVAALTDAGTGEWSLPATLFVDRLFGPAGDRKTLGQSTFFAPTRILPPATRYGVAIRNRRGHDTLRSGLYDPQPEWWSWTSQGGSDAAVIQVAVKHGPQEPALRHVLDWLGHDVIIHQPGSAHTLWSGYVNSVTVPIGEFALRRSLEGYANDLKVKWTRPATEHTGAVDFVSSAVNPEAAWQQARFGVRSVIVESDNTLVELDQDDVDRLLAEYQGSPITARMDRDIPSGAVLECRGHAGILDQRFFPTRSAGQYGSVTHRDDDNHWSVQYRVDNGPARHDELYQYANLNPNQGHGPMSPDWDTYLRRVRFWSVRRSQSEGPDSGKQRFTLGLFALGSGLQPGAELSSARVQVGYQQPIGLSASKTPVTIDWAANGDPLLKLPTAWYFGIIDDSEQHATGVEFDRASTRFWSDSTNSGRLLVQRHESDRRYTARLDHLSFDFFVGVTAEGLAKWLASEHDDIGAWPANAAAGVYGAQIGMYYEGDTSWRQAIDQLCGADRLIYGVNEHKMLRFWSADGPNAAPVEWPGAGGANLGAFIGRRLSIDGNTFLLTGASYDAMTGQVDFSSPGKPSATVAGTRIGNLT